jgi:hypothetical protein
LQGKRGATVVKRGRLTTSAVVPNCLLHTGIDDTGEIQSCDYADKWERWLLSHLGD